MVEGKLQVPILWWFRKVLSGNFCEFLGKAFPVEKSGKPQKLAIDNWNSLEHCEKRDTMRHFFIKEGRKQKIFVKNLKKKVYKWKK